MIAPALLRVPSQFEVDQGTFPGEAAVIFSGEQVDG
jgi:hypothetical protein